MSLGNPGIGEEQNNNNNNSNKLFNMAKNQLPTQSVKLKWLKYFVDAI